MIKALLNYQTEDANLRKIEAELMGSEDRKKAVSAKKFLDSVPESLEKLNELSQSLSAEYQSIVDEQKKLQEQEAEFSRIVENVEDKNEANYLFKKIDEVLAKIKSLASKLTKISEEMQSVVKEYVALRNKIKVAQEQYAESGKKYNELKASLAEEKDKIEAKLAKLAKEVDPKLMEAYGKKRANKIFPIVYKIRGEVCGCCNMELSMSEINKLKNGEILEHDQCGRLIYLSED